MNSVNTSHQVSRRFCCVIYELDDPALWSLFTKNPVKFKTSNSNIFVHAQKSVTRNLIFEILMYHCSILRHFWLDLVFLFVVLSEQYSVGSS